MLNKEGKIWKQILQAEEIGRAMALKRLCVPATARRPVSCKRVKGPPEDLEQNSAQGAQDDFRF